MSLNKLLPQGRVGTGLNITSSTLSAENLTPLLPLKTDNLSRLISTKLDIDDINDLENRLNQAVSNPLISDLDCNGNNLLNIGSNLTNFSVFQSDTASKTQNITSLPNSTTINGALSTNSLTTGFSQVNGDLVVASAIVAGQVKAAQFVCDTIGNDLGDKRLSFNIGSNIQVDGGFNIGASDIIGTNLSLKGINTKTENLSATLGDTTVSGTLSTNNLNTSSLLSNTIVSNNIGNVLGDKKLTFNTANIDMTGNLNINTFDVISTGLSLKGINTKTQNLSATLGDTTVSGILRVGSGLVVNGSAEVGNIFINGSIEGGQVPVNSGIDFNSDVIFKQGSDVSFATNTGWSGNFVPKSAAIGSLGSLTSPFSSCFLSGSSNSLSLNTTGGNTLHKLATGNTFAITDNTAGQFQLLKFNVSNTSILSQILHIFSIGIEPTTNLIGSVGSTLKRFLDGYFFNLTTTNLFVNNINGNSPAGGIFMTTTNSTAITATSVETSIINNASFVGSLVFPSNTFQISSYHFNIAGQFNSTNGDSLIIRLKSNATVLSTFVVPLNSTSNQFFELEGDISVRQLGGAGLGQISTNFDFTFSDTVTFLRGNRQCNVNSTTFNTTISNTLDVSAEFSSNNANNRIQTLQAILNRTY